jgi:hypothetical protein
VEIVESDTFGGYTQVAKSLRKKVLIVEQETGATSLGQWRSLCDRHCRAGRQHDTGHAVLINPYETMTPPFT